jgi:hypothetical protein
MFELFLSQLTLEYEMLARATADLAVQISPTKKNTSSNNSPQLSNSPALDNSMSILNNSATNSQHSHEKINILPGASEFAR